jgi:hypothetical protein
MLYYAASYYKKYNTIFLCIHAQDNSTLAFSYLKLNLRLEILELKLGFCERGHVLFALLCSFESHEVGQLCYRENNVAPKVPYMSDFTSQELDYINRD